jgi:ADP-dependent NAD(P)H-hydrate dehydratase / NAD(P)H-hydrate epimerase
MIPLYSTRQIRKVDDYAINRLKIPGIVLMENASREIFEIVQSAAKHLATRKVGFFCGKGNNGGDGFAAARHFSNAGYEVIVIYLGSENEMSTDCRINFNILKKISSEVKNIQIKNYRSSSSLVNLKNCDLIFDALLGSGVEGKLREPYPTIINYLNKIDVYKIAVDIPTGVNSETGSAEMAFRADLTVTLGDFKKGLFIGDGAYFSGKVEKGTIGIPDELFRKDYTDCYLVEPEDALKGLPVKKKNLHKYSAGKVLTIAGSGSLPGAAVLTSVSALKIGAGASILCFPKSIRSFVHKKLGEVVVHPYEDNGAEFLQTDNIEEFSERIKWADVAAIGPGLGREAETQNTVFEILKNNKPKVTVIDADAVYALSKKRYKKLHLRKCVFTPHHAEFANLIGISVEKLRKDLLKYGQQFSITTGAYLVLKGAPTITFTPGGEALVNSSGNPALAKFGTGDVLTGLIAGLIAQNKEIEKSVITAVYLHGLIADILVRKRTSYDLLATDLINNISHAINFLKKSVV